MDNIQKKVTLVFDADVANAKAQLEGLNTSLNKLGDVARHASSSDLPITKEIREASAAAKQLQQNLALAMNEDTGKLDLSKFAQQMKASGMSLKKYQQQLVNLGPSGEKAFAQLASSIMRAEIPLKKTNKMLDEFATSLKNTARWQISSTLLHGFMSQLQRSYSYAQDLNKSLNNIRIVTGYGVDKMSAFAKQANIAAKALSSTTTAYTDASLIYYQQGLNDQQVKERTDATIKMANVTGQSAKIVSDQMTAVWNNFDNGSKSLEYYADVMNALGAATASSTDEIAQGLSKFAAISDTVGLSYEYATAALASVTAKTRQSADIVGTAFKTIFARMQSLKLGETLEDGTDLTKYTQALASVGVNVKNVNGELKNADVIIDEMMDKWGSLTKAQQAATAQSVAGIRQYSQFMALMNSKDDFRKNLDVARNSEGTLDKQQAIYAESWEAASDRVKASLEEIYDELLDDEAFIKATNAVSKLIEGVDVLIDGVGGLKGVLMGLGLAFNQIFSKQIVSTIDDAMYWLRMKTKQGREDLISLKKEAGQRVVSTFRESISSDNAGQMAAYGYRQQSAESLEYLSVVEKASDEEKVKLDILLQQNQALREQGVLTAEELDKAEAMTEKQRQKLMSKTILSGSTGESDDVKNARLSFESAVDNESIFVETNKALSKTTPNNQAEIAAQVENALAGMQKSTGVDASEVIKEAQKYLAVLKDTKATEIEVQKAKEEWENAVTNACAEATEAEKEYTKAVQDTYNQRDHAETLQGKNKKYTKAQKTIRARNGDTAQKEVESYGDSRRERAESAFRVGSSEANIDAGSEAFNKAAGEIQGKIPSLTEGFNGLTTASLGFASSLSMVFSLWEVHKDPDLSGWEKLTRYLTTGAMFLSTVPQIISGAKLAYQGLLTVSQQETVSKIANTAATWVNAKAEKVLHKTRQDGISVTKDATKANLEEAASDVTEATVKKTVDKKGRVSYRDEKGHFVKDGKLKYDQQQAMPQTKGMSQTEIDAMNGDLVGGGPMGGTAKAASPVMSQAAGMATAVAGVALIAASVYVGKKVANKAADDALEAQKSYGQMADAADKAREKSEAFSNAIASYDKGVDALDSLTKGTEEYSKQLEDVNAQALDLIDEYDELRGKSFTDENGVIRFEEGALEEAKAAANEKKMMALHSKSIAKGVANEAQQEADIVEFNRKYAKSEQAGTSEDWTAVGVGAGVGAGTALAGAGIGAALGSAVPVLGTAIGAAIGLALGATVGAIYTAVKDEDETESEKEAIEKLSAEYSKNGDAIFNDIDQTFADLEITDQNLIDSLKANEGELRKLIVSIDANTKAELQRNKQTIHEKYGSNIETAVVNSKGGITSGQTDLIETMAAGALSKETERLYSEKYEDQWFGDHENSDKVMRENYAKMMGWDVSKIEGSGNSATYYDKQGNKIMSDLSDEVIRKALAEQEATNNMSETLKNILKTVQKMNSISTAGGSSLYQTVHDDGSISNEFTEAMASFTDGGKNASVNNLNYEQLNSFVSTLKAGNLTDADAKAYGFDSLTQMMAKVNEVVAAQNKQWENINSNFHGVSYKEALHLQSSVSSEDSAAMAKFYSGLTESQKGIFAQFNTASAHSVDFWESKMNSANAKLAQDYAKKMKGAIDVALNALSNQKFDIDSQKGLQEALAGAGINYSAMVNMSIGEQEEFLKGIRLQMVNAEWEGLEQQQTSDISTYEKLATEYNFSNEDAVDEEGHRLGLSEHLTQQAEGRQAEINSISNLTDAEINEYVAAANAAQAAAKEAGEETYSFSFGRDGEVQSYEYNVDGTAITAQGIKDLANSKTEEIGKEKTALEADAAEAGALEASINQNNQILAGKELSLQRENFAAEGLDVAEIEDYADHLQAINTESDNLDDNLGENEKAARTVAGGIMKMDKGVEKLAKGFDDWSDILKNSSKSSQEYSKAMGETKDALGDVLGVEKSLISNDFVEKHLEEIGKAAEGDEKAIEKLQRAMSEDILKNLSSGVEFDTIKDEVNSFLDGIKDKEIKIGAVFEAEYDDDGNIIQGQSDEFIAEAQNIVNAAKMTAEEAQSYFNSIGFEPEFVMEPQPVEQESPIMVEETQVRGVTSGTYESNGKEVPWERPILETTSYQDGVKKYTGMMMKVAMSNDGTPKIKTLTKKAPPSMGNFSSSNKGGKKPGGGKKSSPAKPIKQTKKSEVVERYKEITDAIDDVTDATEKASSAADRLYGPEKIKALKQVIKLEEKHVQQLKEKRKEAYNYLSQDRAALDKAAADAGVSLSYDSMGNITNYTEEFSKLYEELAAVQQKANAFKDAEAQSDYVEKNVDPVQEKIDKLKEQQQQYEETRELIEDLDAEIREKENEIIDKRLEKLTYPIELRIEVDASQLEYLDYLLGKIEDRSFNTAQEIDLIFNKVPEINSQIAATQQGIETVIGEQMSDEDKALYMQGRISEIDLDKYDFNQAHIDKLKEYNDALLEYNNQLMEIQKLIHEKILEAYDEWNEKLQKQISLYDHYNSIVDSMKEIAGLTGHFASQELKDSLFGAGVEIAEKQYQSAKDNYNAQVKVLEDLKAKRAELAATASEEELERWDKDIEHVEEQVLEAEENLYAKVQEYISLASEQLTNEIEKSLKELDAALAGTAGTLENLGQKIDRQKALNDQFLTDYEKAYRLNKLNRDIQKSIDDTDNIRGKEILRDLQKDIYKYQKDGVKMSQYDIDYNQKLYELRLAQIALEESQNAKDTVKLSRDDEGNWGYVYTANQDNVAQAQQNYEDKLFELQELSNNYANELSDNILQTEQECVDALRTLYEQWQEGHFATEEEYLAAVAETTQFYQERMNYFTDELDKTTSRNESLYNSDWIKYQTVTNEKITKTKEFQTSFQETMIGKFSEDLTESQGLFENFMNAIGSVDNENSFLGKMDISFKNWETNVNKALSEVGSSLGSLNKDFQKYIGSAKDKNSILGQVNLTQESVVETVYEQMIPSINDIISKVGDWSAAHDKELQKIIAKNERAAQSFNALNEAVVKATEDEAKKQAEEEAKKKAAAEAEKQASEATQQSNSLSHSEMVQLVFDMGRGNYGNGSARRKALDENYPGMYSIAQGFLNEALNKDRYNYSHNATKWKKTIEEIVSTAGYDTGGYTGEWGPQGKLALLHQKEIVLNAADTSNLLATVSALRDIVKVVNIPNLLEGIVKNASIYNTNANEQNVHQDVHITAEFPNVNDHNEIEEALNNLINNASQFTGRNY